MPKNPSAREDSRAGTAATATGGEQGVMSQAKEAAGEAVGQVQEKAGRAVDAAKQRAASQADKQKEKAAGGLSTVADAIRQTCQHLREQEQGSVPQYAAQYGDRAADQIERLSGYLREHDISDMAHELEGVARRNPTAFVGGAFVLGLLGARFLKSSRPQQQSSGDSRSHMEGGSHAVAPRAGGAYAAGTGPATALPPPAVPEYEERAVPGTAPPRGIGR